MAVSKTFVHYAVGDMYYRLKTDWDRAGRGLSQIFSPQVLAVCTRAPRLLLKAPRALDPSTLPRLAQAWQLSPAWSPRAASPAERVLFLRACTST